MGQMSIGGVVSLLRTQNIPAEAAFPPESISRITQTVAAVSMDEAVSDQKTVTILVDVVTPREIGGYVCQQKAQEICAILVNAGAVCHQGKCTYSREGSIFLVPVKATFQDVEPFTVVTGTLTLPYACGFSAEQVPDADGTISQSGAWEFTVEEFFPWGVLDTLEAESPFLLELRSMENAERFWSCRWISRKRIAEKMGIRQIRKGSATKRSVTSI